MRIIDLTHSMSRRAPADDLTHVVIRSVDSVDRIPPDRLLPMATVVDLTNREELGSIKRSDVSGTGVSDIAGCILRTDWMDDYLAGIKLPTPILTVEAAVHLLEGGVRTIAADFPIALDSADLLLHNDCVLVSCLSNIRALSEKIVRLIALPLKLEDTYCAEARVMAME